MNRQSFRKIGKLLAFVLAAVLSVPLGVQAGADSSLIFHSGFEPGTVGVPSGTDPGTLYDITGTDATFPDHNNWVTDLDGHPKLGNLTFQYETLDNSRQRYAKISDDPTGILFEDSFEELYGVGDKPRTGSNDVGKRNWSYYTAANTQVTVQADPLASANQVVKVLSTAAGAYSKLDKVLNLTDVKKMVISYKVLNNGGNTYIEFSGSVAKSSVIRISNSTATAGSYSKPINPDAWTEVSVECDFENNLYSATVNGEVFAKNIPLLAAAATDLSNVKIRFNSNLLKDQYYFLDDVSIKKTPILFEDNLECNYSLGDLPHRIEADKSRTKWSYMESDGAQTAVAEEPAHPENKVLKVSSDLPGTIHPKVGKLLDVSSSQRITADYRVMNLSGNTALQLSLPTVSAALSKTLVSLSGSGATAGGNAAVIDPNGWTAISVSCDLYNNMYSVSVNGSTLTTGALLFSKAQTDFRNVRLDFCAGLTTGNCYYIDDINISEKPNNILKYYGGTVVNDSKLRIQSTISNNKNLNEVYFKYRVYFSDGFARLGEALTGMSSYWFTLAEFFDGSCWAWTGPDPNYTSRISMGIAKPTAAGAPLKFQVNHQHAKLNEPEFNSTPIWDYTSTAEVPIGQWVTVELYLKQGIGTDPNNGGGRFQMVMTGADGVKQTVFDVNNSTYNSNMPTDGFEHTYPMKFYGNRLIFSNMAALGSDLRMYWDDFEVRSTLPTEIVEPEAPAVFADDVANVLTGLDLATMEYAVSTDGGITYGGYTANPPSLFNGSKFVKIRVKAQGSNPAGVDTVLVFTPNAGDVNGDGLIDISDVVVTAEIAVGATYSQERVSRANVSSKQENMVDISDVILIAERAVGDTAPFPVDLP